MAISYQVTKTLFERVLSDYDELNEVLNLHPSATANQLKEFVSERIQTIHQLATQIQMDGFAFEDMHRITRRLKLELRTAQRSWKRHLVTEARLNQHKKISDFAPNFAA